MAERVLLTIGTKKGVFVAEAPKSRSKFTLRGPHGQGVGESCEVRRKDGRRDPDSHAGRTLMNGARRMRPANAKPSGK